MNPCEANGAGTIGNIYCVSLGTGKNFCCGTAENGHCEECCGLAQCTAFCEYCDTAGIYGTWSCDEQLNTDYKDDCDNIYQVCDGYGGCEWIDSNPSTDCTWPTEPVFEDGKIYELVMCTDGCSSDCPRADPYTFYPDNWHFCKTGPSDNPFWELNTHGCTWCVDVNTPDCLDICVVTEGEGCEDYRSELHPLTKPPLDVSIKNKGNDDEEDFPVCGSNAPFDMNRLGMLQGKTRQLILLNVALSICVLSILYFNNNKRRIVVDVNRGSEPRELLDVLGWNNLGFTNNDQAIFIFKSRPTLTYLEIIEKLNHLYKDEIDFYTIFSTRFRLSRDFHVPHGFFIRNKFVLVSSIEASNNQPSFLLLSGNKVVLVDRLLELFQLARILEWKLRPGKNNEVVFSREDLRSILLDRLKQKQFVLLDVSTRLFSSLEQLLLSDIDELYLVHATCSSCELNKVLTNVGESRRKELLIILSVHADSYETESLLKSQNAKARVFIDYYDGLGLLHTGSKENFNLFAFKRGDLLR